MAAATCRRSAIHGIDSLLAEAEALTARTRDYITHCAPEVHAGLPLADQLQCMQEISRLTARLTHSMAWLLARRAVHLGEVDVAEAHTERWRLGGRAVCAQHTDRPELPPALRALLAESAQLYQRLMRLDDLLHGAAPRECDLQPSPGAQTRH